METFFPCFPSRPAFSFRAMETQRGFKLLNVFTGFFVAVLVVVPSLGAKFIAVGPFYFPGGTLIFPLTFIINGVLTEVYGFARSRRVIWIGMGCQFLAAVAWWLVGVWPSAPFWHNQESYDAILGIAPRITLGSFTAYFCGEFLKSVLLSKMKFAQGGKRGVLQGWRFIASSIAGEFIDSAVFMFVAFAGTQSAADLFKLALTLWIAKVIYEIVALPLSLWLANRVKQIEGVDKIDRPEETNYNPFASFLKGD
ncbi:MAG TPA: queuosine precursor transporter [Methylomirabilota bacterium]|nr:queuosine precursor transporter [Methylomirabilota bacterium]